MVEDEPAQANRCALHLFGRGRQPGEKCQFQSSSCIAVCQRGWGKGARSRRPGWGLHGKGRRRSLDCADCQPGGCDTAFGGLSGGDLASARHPPESQDPANEMGRNTLTVRSARPAVFLDRDGVLNNAIIRNGKPYPPRDLRELVITLGAREALEELRREGFLMIVVTNQPDLARGKA